MPDTRRESREPVQVLIAVGTSTGGPQALSALFASLPVLPDTACVIVQHMPVGFTANLARRLNQLSKWEIDEGSDERVLEVGHAYVAPGGRQMEVRTLGADGGQLLIREGDTVNGHRPSVDVLFHSIAQTWNKPVIGVLMTGMGKDGAQGLLNLSEMGGETIAEAESSCVVYGMPRAAVAIGAAKHVVSLNELAAQIETSHRLLRSHLHVPR